MTQLQQIGRELHPNRHSAQDRARQDAWDRLGREVKAMVKALGGTDRQAQQAASVAHGHYRTHHCARLAKQHACDWAARRIDTRGEA